jgi:hypothetical protein
MTHSRSIRIGLSAFASLAILTGSAHAGSLSGTVATVPSTASLNLTTQGTTDWYNYAYSDVAVSDHKSGGAGIGTFTVTQPTVSTTTYPNASNGMNIFGNYGSADQPERTWTDGTAGTGLHPTGNGGANLNPEPGNNYAGNGSRYGISGISYASDYSDGSGVGSGYSFSVTATSAPQVFTLYVGNSFASGILTAVLSDGTSVTYTNTNTNTGGAYVNSAYSFTFSDATPGTKLNVSWMETTRYGAYDNIGIEASTLAPAAAPEPGQLTAWALGGLGVIALVRRQRRVSARQ